jgi:C-terminal processing protease CtpA/Prc
MTFTSSVARSLPFILMMPLASHSFAGAAKPPAVEVDETTNRYKNLETLARGLFYLETMYVDPEKVKEDDMVQHALKGVVDHLDPHTMLMPAKAFEDRKSVV